MRTLSKPPRANVTDSDLPSIGQWYLHERFDEPVEVVHVDRTAGTVDVHDAPGRIHEMLLSDWIAADKQPIPAPENLFRDVADPEDETLTFAPLKIAV